jgi:hypothetical protein
MPIALEDGYYLSHDLAHVTCLGVDSGRLGECVARVKANRIKGVFGHSSYGFTGQDLDFLSEIPWVEAVWFWDINLNNIDGLYALSELRYFGVSPKRPPIDFSKFPKLRKAIVEPKAHDRGLGALSQLELLHIWRYRPKQKDFSALEFSDSLSELQINWANPSSLESLPEIRGLRRLEVHRCRNLESLGDLGTKFPNLEHLVVAACGRVLSGEGERVIRDLPNLSHAYVRDAKLV